MAIGALVLFVVPLTLLVFGGVITGRAIVSWRRGSGIRAAHILRVIAGAGVLLCAVIAVAGFVVEMHYAVVVLPVLGLLAALIWSLGFLSAAGIAELVARRRRAAVSPP